MKTRALVSAVALTLALGATCAATAAPEFGGQLRAEATPTTANARGPLALAESLQPGISDSGAAQGGLQAELRASGHGLAATGTLRQERLAGSGWKGRAWVNEWYGAAGDAGWQFSAGKRIVAWDVGYAFRPNDVVQQESRRQLLTSTAEGRPLLMAEYFSASTAWSLVWVNPTHRRDIRGAAEPALAARGYLRDGSVDWHAFARWGGHTRGSVGGAVAWVASDAVELHASLRAITAADTSVMVPGTSGLQPRKPWVDAQTRHVAQALLGGTWTNAEQLSVLVEAWWDGTAAADASWDAWGSRNQELQSLLATPAPRAAVAGNLAWQTSAFGSAGNLRRANFYARASWTPGAWQPVLDLLLTPADGGRIVTASVAWQGDRLRMEGGLRQYGGPGNAVLAQLPTRRVAYLAATLSF